MDTLSTRRSRVQDSFRRILFSPRYFTYKPGKKSAPPLFLEDENIFQKLATLVLCGIVIKTVRPPTHAPTAVRVSNSYCRSVFTCFSRWLHWYRSRTIEISWWNYCTRSGTRVQAFKISSNLEFSKYRGYWYSGTFFSTMYIRLLYINLYCSKFPLSMW
jgi:hypothetical protein